MDSKQHSLLAQQELQEAIKHANDGMAAMWKNATDPLQAFMASFESYGAAVYHVASMGSPPSGARAAVNRVGTILGNNLHAYRRLWYKRKPRSKLHGF